MEGTFQVDSGTASDSIASKCLHSQQKYRGNEAKNKKTEAECCNERIGDRVDESGHGCGPRSRVIFA